MKKIILALVICTGVAITASAQETKTKPVTTPGDKVHNTIHPHNKVQHGTKYKHETASGKKTTTTVKSNHQEALEPKKKVEKKS